MRVERPNNFLRSHSLELWKTSLSKFFSHMADFKIFKQEFWPKGAFKNCQEFL